MMSTYNRLGMPRQTLENLKLWKFDEVWKIIGTNDNSTDDTNKRTPTLSQIGSSPTKISKHSAYGLPVFLNQDFGDLNLLLESGKVGVILRSFDKIEMAKAANEILAISSGDEIVKKYVKVAYEFFGLHKVDGQKYQDIHYSLTK